MTLLLEEYNINFDNELPIDYFVPMGFYKIAESGLKPEEYLAKNPESSPIVYTPVSGLERVYREYRELVYIMAVDDKVAKIGGTYTGMFNRLSSYSAGSLKNRNNGTCSVTNFKVTYTQYNAIANGKKVDWYVYDIPTMNINLDVWGESVQYIPKTYYKYESALCLKYKELTGRYPLLSKNIGIE